MRYQIKRAASRGTALVAAAGLLGGIGTSALPALASANALNPLTQRSLMLTSSAPGYVNTDGAGNPVTQYSEPGSGPNGKQTGETVTFKVSSTATIKAFTLQYCTTPAGYCLSPGDDLTETTPSHTDDASHSDLNVNFPSPSEGTVTPGASAHTSTNNFQIFTGGVQGTGTAGTGWTMAPSNKEDSAHFGTALAAGNVTGKNNFVTFTNATGVSLTAGEQVSIVFYGTDTNYITNPGSGAFFAKINDYNSDTLQDSTTIVDGGVTVANVMNDSIQIQTKVLETMSFSVGTVNPDTVHQAGGHGTCDAITTNNPIQMGDPNAEYSLSTTTAYDGISYWRLSSNSSNGATVYYAGYTLSNTENNQITPAYDLVPADGHTQGDGSTTDSHPGTEQFGLAMLPTNSTADPDPNPDSLSSTGTLSPLTSVAAYAGGDGTINGTTPTAMFAFKTTSQYSPEPIASENTSVVHCSTGKMRYLANIAPDTPAGIYTSKINYLASPQY